MPTEGSPEIHDFLATPLPDNMWTFTGRVTDDEDDPTGWII